MIFWDFFLSFTISIYRFTQIFCIFLNEEESYWYNSGRFGKPWKRATFFIFSIFRPFPHIVHAKFSHIQKKPVVDFVSVKFYKFCYFYNLQGPWEYFTYSNYQLQIWFIINPILTKTNQCLNVFLSIFISFTSRGNFWGYVVGDLSI